MTLHSKKLYQQGKFLGLVPCPGCGDRGGLWEAYEPSWVGWTRYCYLCSWIERYERDMELEQRKIQIRNNDRKIAELKLALYRAQKKVDIGAKMRENADTAAFAPQSGIQTIEEYTA